MAQMRQVFILRIWKAMSRNYLDIFSDQRRHKKKGKRDQIDYAVCNNEAALLYLINLGNIDLNPWSSRIQPQEPDFISIDLDPSDEDFGKAIKTAQAAKKVFEKNKLQSLVKTSGKTGIHLFLPCQDLRIRRPARLLKRSATWFAAKYPTLPPPTLLSIIAATKLFVDPSQNDYADTLASVYSVRPYKHPTVSTPLEWKEVKDKLDPGKFTMDTFRSAWKRKAIFSKTC
jgi:bifunctional non-homologous end joining protein LigD